MEQPSSQDIQKTLSRLTHELHLGAVRGHLEEIAAQAVAEGWDYRRFLCELLQTEHEQRAENAQAKRLKTAGFPQYKYMEELDPDELPEGVKPLLNELKALEFIRQGRNAVFYGNPGTGKTHLSTRHTGMQAAHDGALHIRAASHNPDKGVPLAADAACTYTQGLPHKHERRVIQAQRNKEF